MTPQVIMEEWVRSFKDNEISWEGHGDTLRTGATYLEEALTRIAELEAELADALYAWRFARDGRKLAQDEVARLREANRAACDALVWIKNHDGSPPSFRMAAENALRVQEALAEGGQEVGTR